MKIAYVKRDCVNAMDNVTNAGNIMLSPNYRDPFIVKKI